MKADLILEAAYALVLTSAAAISVFIIAMALSATCDLVGERAPSPSPGVPTATARADSEAAPARSLETGASGTVVGGVGELADPPSSGVIPDDGASVRAGSSLAPASTVTQSALTATATVVIDPVPATPVATSRAVETLAPKSINSYDPWPAYLWPVVECIVQRESGGNPHGPDGSQGERGLMQVHPVTWPYLAEFGITPDALYDGATNIRAGWLLYLWNEKYAGDGLRPWGGGC